MRVDPCLMRVDLVAIDLMKEATWSYALCTRIFSTCSCILYVATSLGIQRKRDKAFYSYNSEGACIPVLSPSI